MPESPFKVGDLGNSLRNLLAAVRSTEIDYKDLLSSLLSGSSLACCHLMRRLVYSCMPCLKQCVVLGLPETGGSDRNLVTVTIRVLREFVNYHSPLTVDKFLKDCSHSEHKFHILTRLAQYTKHLRDFHKNRDGKGGSPTARMPKSGVSFMTASTGSSRQTQPDNETMKKVAKIKERNKVMVEKLRSKDSRIIKSPSSPKGRRKFASTDNNASSDGISVVTGMTNLSVNTGRCSTRDTAPNLPKPKDIDMERVHTPKSADLGKRSQPSKFSSDSLEREKTHDCHKDYQHKQHNHDPHHADTGEKSQISIHTTPQVAEVTSAPTPNTPIVAKTPSHESDIPPPATVYPKGLSQHFARLNEKSQSATEREKKQVHHEGNEELAAEVQSKSCDNTFTQQRNNQDQQLRDHSGASPDAMSKGNELLRMENKALMSMIVTLSGRVKRLERRRTGVEMFSDKTLNNRSVPVSALYSVDEMSGSGYNCGRSLVKIFEKASAHNQLYLPLQTFRGMSRDQSHGKTPIHFMATDQGDEGGDDGDEARRKGPPPPPPLGPPARVSNTGSPPKSPSRILEDMSEEIVQIHEDALRAIKGDELGHHGSGGKHSFLQQASLRMPPGATAPVQKNKHKDPKGKVGALSKIFGSMQHKKETLDSPHGVMPSSPDYMPGGAASVKNMVNKFGSVKPQGCRGKKNDNDLPGATSGSSKLGNFYQTLSATSKNQNDDSNSMEDREYQGSPNATENSQYDETSQARQEQRQRVISEHILNNLRDEIDEEVQRHMFYSESRNQQVLYHLFRESDHINADLEDRLKKLEESVAESIQVKRQETRDFFDYMQAQKYRHHFTDIPIVDVQHFESIEN